MPKKIYGYRCQLALIKNSNVSKPEIQPLGFKVQSISEIDERLKCPYDLTYRGEPPLEIRRRTSESLYKDTWLQDPDGNFVDLSKGTGKFNQVNPVPI